MSDLCPCHAEPWYVAPDGHRRCRVKMRARQHRWEAKNPQKVREIDRAARQRWAENHPEAQRAAAKRWLEKNREAARTMWRRNRLRRVARNRAIVTAEAESRGNVCGDCGTGPFTGGAEWHWHHRDPANKSETISTLVASAVATHVRAELAKCDLLCSKCHIDLHRSRNKEAI